MKSITTLALCFAIFAAPAAAAEEASPLAAFMGCWRGAFEGLPDIADERCFEPMLGGAFVRDTHAVRPTDYHGETIHYRDAQTNDWAFTYYASNGGVSRGVTRVEEGALVFPAHTFIAADGAEQRLRSTWRLDGADRFVVTSERQEAGVRRPFGVITYARVVADQLRIGQGKIRRKKKARR